MADRITRPQGLGLTFTPGHPVGSPYGNAGAAMIAANKTLANTPNKTAEMFKSINEGLKGLGSGIRDYQENANQAGLRRVLAGGDYNAPSVWDRITATLGHTADGTLGQHEGDRVAIRSTPMDRNPQNIVIGANGRLGYDPGAGAKAQLDAERLRQLKLENDRASQDAKKAAQPGRKLIDGKPVGGDGKEPLPQKNPTDEPELKTELIPGKDAPKSLYPGSNMTTSNDPSQITTPAPPPTPGPVTTTATGTAGSPLSDQSTAPATPGSFDYSVAANSPVALNEAVTPGGDFNYNGSSPMSEMPSPGDVYNAFDNAPNFEDAGGLASSFGPAPFNFDNGGGNYDASQGLYAGNDYGNTDSSGPMSDTPVDVSAGGDTEGSYA